MNASGMKNNSEAYFHGRGRWVNEKNKHRDTHTDRHFSTDIRNDIMYVSISSISVSFLLGR